MGAFRKDLLLAVSIKRQQNEAGCSLVPRPVRAIRVTRGGLEPSATSLTGNVTSEIAEDDWERGWAGCMFPVTFIARAFSPKVSQFLLYENPNMRAVAKTLGALIQFFRAIRAKAKFCERFEIDWDHSIPLLGSLESGLHFSLSGNKGWPTRGPAR